MKKTRRVEITATAPMKWIILVAVATLLVNLAYVLDRLL